MSFKDEDWHLAFRIEGSRGDVGSYGVKIQAAGIDPNLLQNDVVDRALHKATDLVMEAIVEEMIKKDPVAMKAAQDERANLLSIFPEHIYVRAIPNGYCSKACCKHRPWFEVTTSIGVITIGWRKRVINLDYKNTEVRMDAEELFKDYQHTKAHQYVHAYSVEQAKACLEQIYAQHPKEQKLNRKIQRLVREGKVYGSLGDSIQAYGYVPDFLAPQVNHLLEQMGDDE